MSDIMSVGVEFLGAEDMEHHGLATHGIQPVDYHIGLVCGRDLFVRGGDLVPIFNFTAATELFVPYFLETEALGLQVDLSEEGLNVAGDLKPLVLANLATVRLGNLATYDAI